MIRPRLALATFALLTLGAAAGADAAELAGVLLAQSADHRRAGRASTSTSSSSSPSSLIYLLWAWTTYWVDDDAKELNNLRFEIWNSRRLLLRRARLRPGLGDPDLPDRPDPAAPGSTSSRCSPTSTSATRPSPTTPRC